MQHRYFTKITTYKINYTRWNKTYKHLAKELVSDRKNKFVKQTKEKKTIS